jgi:tetratricopeptide (TPR) repeat protein
MGVSMPKSARSLLTVRTLAVAAAVLAVAGLALLLTRRPDVLTLLNSGRPEGGAATLQMRYPLNGTLFPPESPAPLFTWKDETGRCNTWLVAIESPEGQVRVGRFTGQVQWRPEDQVWEEIKKLSLGTQAVVTVIGFNRWHPSKALSLGRCRIGTSADPVGAPLFFREVHLPFIDAVKDPSKIRWRFGAISSKEQPPVVLENLPVCGNCHSFSADAGVFGMDVDYANDKASYAVLPVRPQMTLDKGVIITWSDYKRQERVPTYGLLSQVSPDGRYVVSTVKDESVFVPRPGLEFSQLFFPIKGILCIHDRQMGTFKSLPGADDPNLVQSNAVWSPDGKTLVFARTRAYTLKGVRDRATALLSPSECREFLEEGRPFKFDLFRIPFNAGEGGRPEPLEGASFDGMSNYFPKFSPDGRWIVFCKARNYMLLQGDSELYIIPAEGGKARRLVANTGRMNSWHSFSPNGRWLVFSAKPDSPYTRLFLTHIDANGESTPAMVLDRFTSADRAANIPEFVNAGPGAIQQIREQFIDDLSYTRAARAYVKAGDFAGTERQCRKALELNPDNPEAHHILAMALFGRHQYEEATRHLQEALRIKPDDVEALVHLGAVYSARGMATEAVSTLQRSLQLDPNNASAYFNLGVAAYRQDKRREAIKHWSRTVELAPEDHDAHYNLGVALEQEGDSRRAIEHYQKTVQLKPDYAEAQASLGMALCAKGAFTEGLAPLSKAADLEPNDTAIRYNLAITLARTQQCDKAIGHLNWIIRLEPRNTDALLCLAMAYAETGQRDKAVAVLQDALSAAKAAGDGALAGQITQRISQYSQPAGGR